jgi:diguanylate cyclase (GGDEF)-like protein
MKLKRTHLVSRIANGISFVMLLLLTVFAIWAATLIQQASSTAKQSTFESSTYQQIRHALSEEEALQYEYLLDPSPALRDEHLAVATSVSAMTHVLPQDDATAGDNTLAQHILTEQAHYVFDSGQFFSAIDRKNLTGAHAIYKEIDPSFTSLEKELNQKANEEQAEAAHDLAQLIELEQTIFVTAPIVFGLGLLLLSITISVQRSYHRKLEEATQAERARFNDSLSGLGNHYAYHEQLSRMWEESRRGGEPLTLALLDLDEFKVFNDEQGHQRGDDILRALASLLREANLTDALFRLSADDFALIMQHTPLAEAASALERLREDVSRALCGVSVSIGVTQMGPDEFPLESLQAQAALALQQAKCRGRNRVVTFETIESAASFVPLAKIQAVRRVLSDRKLSMTFQPIWKLATGTVLAFEALTQPAADSGLSGPQELFDIAEHMGRVHELDALCVEKILAHAAELPPDTLLFMNLTPQSLVSDLLTEATLLEGVVSAGLEPSRVVLEITERALVNLAEVVQKARHLRQLGFRIALDDVGAGNAGLEMLSQLSVDFVKIDRTVVVKALTDQAVRSVFLGIITITRESQIPVVAEGIENAEMLAFVQQAEVQYAQGYLLGRPDEEIQVHLTNKGSEYFPPFSLLSERRKRSLC